MDSFLPACQASNGDGHWQCAVDRVLHYRWLLDDPEYPARFEAGRTGATKRARVGALRLANHKERIAKLGAELKRLKAALKG